MNMIVLDTVNKSLRVVLAGAKATLDAHVTSHYADATATGFTEGSTVVKTNGTTKVTIVAAPGASTSRLIREVSIYNDDTAPITATVFLLETATEYTIIKASISVGGTWQMSQQLFDISSVSGILPAANGGTGINNATRTLTVATNGGTLAFGSASKTLTINQDTTLAGNPVLKSGDTMTGALYVSSATGNLISSVDPSVYHADLQASTTVPFLSINSASNLYGIGLFYDGNFKIQSRSNSSTWVDRFTVQRDNGNVLIGTTTDGGHKLQVVSPSAGTPALRLDSSVAAMLGGGTTPTFGTLPTGGTAAQNKWIVIDLDGSHYYIPVWA